MEESKQPRIKVADVIGSIVVTLVFLGLLGIIVWQQLTIADLRVAEVEAAHKASEETRELMIDKYWAEDKAEAAVMKGNVMLETNRALLEAYKESN